MMKTRALVLLALIAMLAMTGAALGEGLEAGEVRCGDVDEAVSELPGFDLFRETDGDETLLPCDGMDDVANAEAAVGWSEDHIISGAVMDSEARFAGYVDRLFGVVSDEGPRRNGLAGDRLTGVPKKAYDYLLARVREVASGQISDTIFYLPESVVPANAVQSLFQGTVNLATVSDALYADCPYEMYWSDLSVQFGYDAAGVWIKFRVAQDFALDAYVTRADSIQAAQVSASNARAVVNQCAALSNYEKLRAYKDYICDATEYNEPAASGAAFYGNPWQLIWVFDSDPSTKVVCEGYAKAFQYLCEMSNIRCVQATGQSHMWNIVTMEDGKNYLVDVTNSDEGKIAHDSDKLFLAGYDVRESDITYGFDFGWKVLYYTYDEKTLGRLPASALELSNQRYSPPEGPVAVPASVTLSASGTVTLARNETLTLVATVAPADAQTTLTWLSENPDVATVDGNGVVTPAQPGVAVITVRTHNDLTASVTVWVTPAVPTGVSIPHGKRATLYMGKTLALSAAVTPVDAETTLTWRSSKDAVATVNGLGVVKPHRAGKATITVETVNGLKASITVTVVDAKKVKLKEGKSATLHVGDKLTLHATVEPAEVKTKLKWQSSDTKVASVSGKGVVKAKKPGKAKITVTTANGKKATIKITVKAK